MLCEVHRSLSRMVKCADMRKTTGENVYSTRAEKIRSAVDRVEFGFSFLSCFAWNFVKRRVTRGPSLYVFEDSALHSSAIREVKKQRRKRARVYSISRACCGHIEPARGGGIRPPLQTPNVSPQGKSARAPPSIGKGIKGLWTASIGCRDTSASLGPVYPRPPVALEIRPRVWGKDRKSSIKA